jgi:hypothetical protein
VTVPSRLDPFDRRVRMLLIDCLQTHKDVKQAEIEFARLLALEPTQEKSLRRWYEQLRR